MSNILKPLFGVCFLISSILLCAQEGSPLDVIVLLPPPGETFVPITNEGEDGFIDPSNGAKLIYLLSDNPYEEELQELKDEMIPELEEEFAETPEKLISNGPRKMGQWEGYGFEMEMMGLDDMDEDKMFVVKTLVAPVKEGKYSLALVAMYPKALAGELEAPMLQAMGNATVRPKKPSPFGTRDLSEIYQLQPPTSDFVAIEDGYEYPEAGAEITYFLNEQPFAVSLQEFKSEALPSIQAEFTENEKGELLEYGTQTIGHWTGYAMKQQSVAHDEDKRLIGMLFFFPVDDGQLTMVIRAIYPEDLKDELEAPILEAIGSSTIRE